MPSEAELTELIYSASADPSLYDGVLSSVLAIFGSAAAGFSLQRIDDGSFAMGAQTGMTEAVLAAYSAEYAAHNVFLQSSSRFGLGVTLTDELHDEGRRSAERFENSLFYSDWVKPQGYRRAIGSALSQRGDHLLIFNQWRGEGRGFDAGEQALQARLARHLRASLDLAERFAQLNRDLWRARHLPQEAKLGVIALTPSGHVKEVNGPAAGLLSQGRGLRVRDERLGAIDPASAVRLADLLARARHLHPGAASELGPVAIACGSGMEPLLAKAIVCPALAIPIPGERTATIFLVVKEIEADRARMQARLESLALRHALTAAETRIAGLRLVSRTLRDAAARAGVTYETARGQFKIVLQKLDVGNQFEFLRLLQADGD